jgi:hypothetical protein
MAPKKKRITVVPLKEVLRRARDFDEPSRSSTVVREVRKTEPYGVAIAEPRKGARK